MIHGVFKVIYFLFAKYKNILKHLSTQLLFLGQGNEAQIYDL